MRGPRLLDMHVKDLKIADRQGQPVRCGRRHDPVPGAVSGAAEGGLQRLRESRIRDQHGPAAGMQRSFSYMRGVMAGIKG